MPGEVFPLFTISGGTVPVDTFGAVGNANRIATVTNFDYIANFTEIHGKQTLKYGLQYTRDNANDLSRIDPSGAKIANTGINLADMTSRRRRRAAAGLCSSR